ncbi:MAG: hypothetical protein LPK38_05740 [Actinomycetes bacterium]|nr:hypothetical protein [Actinomycetes bacterium]MDX5380793.1 hypothetical protein [Actinomycetes bacterium]MDX5399834.1 hypothetical protein [Actinomycetes bacterium]MDX5450536.1 hypothetical protein [Actinomycetes bacterium]
MTGCEESVPRCVWCECHESVTVEFEPVPPSRQDPANADCSRTPPCRDPRSREASRPLRSCPRDPRGRARGQHGRRARGAVPRAWGRTRRSPGRGPLPRPALRGAQLPRRRRRPARPRAGARRAPQHHGGRRHHRTLHSRRHPRGRTRRGGHHRGRG